MRESFKESNKHLRKLNFDLVNYFSNTIIPQLFVDAELVLRLFTPPAMDQFSLTRKDMNRSIHEVKDNIRYPTIVENIEEVIATQEILEKEIQTDDGRWFKMNILPYIEHEEERTNGVIITFVDISSSLASIKELEELHAKHDVLLFALSHDIRQPLSTVRLLTGGLREAFKRRDAENFDRWVNILRESADHLKLLVDDFTKEVASEREREEPDKRLNIEEISQDVLNALREEIRANKVEVSTDFETSEIKFPRNNLRSIVYNLLHNAIKYRKPGVPLQVKISTAKIDDYVLLCVQDNGMGIAEENQAAIFERATRIHHDIDGTGMGLYIIKQMIESHGGRITLKSRLGDGSVFKVYFQSSRPNRA